MIVVLASYLTSRGRRLDSLPSILGACVLVGPPLALVMLATLGFVAAARGDVEFGGQRGSTLKLKAGDIAILPAGTGHRRVDASDDFLCVGAYPPSGKLTWPLVQPPIFGSGMN